MGLPNKESLAYGFHIGPLRGLSLESRCLEKFSILQKKSMKSIVQIGMPIMRHLERGKIVTQVRMPDGKMPQFKLRDYLKIKEADREIRT